MFLTGPSNSKSKDKTEPHRQSTLFGLPLGQPTEKRGRKKKLTEDSSQSSTVGGGSETTTPADSVSGTQTSDITMADTELLLETTIVETQPLDEAYETQTETQIETQETQEDSVDAERVSLYPSIFSLVTNYFHSH